ncbi:MAG: hypothetical protein QM758_28505 [Armatimonas sp.]
MRSIDITIRWPARSRVIQAPASALSARFILHNASVSGTDVTLIVHRDETMEPYEHTYTFPEAVTTGEHPLEIMFYGNASADGAIVATGGGNVAPNPSGMLPDVSLVGQVASVTVLPGQIVTTGTPAALLTEVRDTTGAVMALSAESFFWRVVSGETAVRFENNKAVVIRPGIAQIAVTVDGVNSPAQTISARSTISMDISPREVTLAPGSSATFNANVSSLSAEPTGVVWSVVEGAAGGTIDMAGHYSAPVMVGTYHVRATSIYDPERYVEASIIVATGGVVVGGEFPGTGGVGAGGDFPETGGVGVEVR